MSHRELRRRVRPARHLCAACRERKARYQYHGHVRADHDHVLCFQCFRAERERVRARQLATAPSFAQASAPQPCRPLTMREIEHRRRMLAACEQALRVASSSAQV
jgi:hypothetical protein